MYGINNTFVVSPSEEITFIVLVLGYFMVHIHVIAMQKCLM